MTQQKDRWQIATFVVETIAAVGVVFSVIYLALQVGGNTAALKAQTHDNVLSQIYNTGVLPLKDPALGILVTRGMKEPDTLSDEEWARFTNYQLLAHNTWEYGYYLNQTAATPPQVWAGMNAYYSEFAKTQPGLKRFWKESGYIFVEPFHSFADQYFSAEVSPPG